MNLSILTASLAGAAVIGLAPLSAMAAPVHSNARPPVQSSSKQLFNFHGRMVAGPFASPRLSQAWSHRLPAEMTRRGITRYVWNRNIKPDKCKTLLYGSENLTGDLDQYCEDGPSGQTPIQTLALGGGWGVAVLPKSKVMAVGVNGGTVNIYNAVNLALQSTQTLSGQSSGYNGYGLCWDDKGGLFATNWPGNTVDYFAGAATALGPVTPVTTTTTAAGGFTPEDYYLACDFDKKETGNNGYLMVYGFILDGVTDPSALMEIPLPYNGGSQTMTTNQTLGSLGNGNGFPGGLTLNKKDDLLANNQYGTLYDLGTKEPWTAPIVGSCTWGFNPNDFTNIVYDTKAKEVWASNINFANGLYTYLQSVGAPPLSGACVTPGESGGPTNPIYNQEYLGVGVYKASAS